MRHPFWLGIQGAELILGCATGLVLALLCLVAATALVAGFVMAASR